MPAILGAYFNAAANIHRANNGGDIFKFMAAGALTGVAGVGAGGMVSGLVGTGGFFAGSMTGATGGFAASFIGGAGNAWITGASFEEGLKQGLISGGTGALVGGLVGGLAGGIDAYRHDGNFWTGKGATYDQLATTPSTSNQVQVGEGMEYTNEYARAFSDEKFGKNIRGLDNLYADGRIPNHLGYTRNGDLVFNAKNQLVRGTAVPNRAGGSDVYLYKMAFISKGQLYRTMGHEYIHVAQNLARLPESFLYEHYAHKWDYEQLMRTIGWRDYNPWKYYLLPIQEDLRYNIKAW
ncbi:MAG: hypothetical protein LBR81_05360 [Prevotellaceae bacterium]|nr:hypothetical protein [Prevotellaceae bacterium]